MSNNDGKQISIVIPKEMYEWLDEHRNINRSELFRQSVQSLMTNEKQKVDPLLFLASIMGIVFSIALIGIAITPTPIHVITRGLLALLGGILAVATSYLYFREVNTKVKKA
ncbi:MAG: ribbon-helix-helix domain-containing protein [Promethearchaeota archaeon]